VLEGAATGSDPVMRWLGEEAVGSRRPCTRGYLAAVLPDENRSKREPLAIANRNNHENSC
jgi:hypothetical protein